MDPVQMHAAYVKERTGADVLTDPDKGFATWVTLPSGDVYLVDIYVSPEFRQSGVAAGLADRIAAAGKARGAKKLIGSVDVRTATCTAALKALLAYGMGLDHVDGQMLWLSKEI